MSRMIKEVAVKCFPDDNHDQLRASPGDFIAALFNPHKLHHGSGPTDGGIGYLSAAG